MQKLKEKLKNMSKEELRELKRTGRLKELLGDAYDSEASFMRTNTTLSPVSQESSSDEDDGGGGGRKGKGKGRKAEDDAARRRRGSKAAKEGAGSKKGAGKGGAKKGRGGADWDSADSADDRKAKDKKKGKKGKGEGGESSEDDATNTNTATVSKEATVEDEEDDSDCSYRSEVSEGGTRYKVKRKRLRDAEGRVVGYGDPEVVPDEFRGASVLGREGSISGASDADYHDSFRPGDLGLPEGRRASKDPAWKADRERRRQSRLDTLAVEKIAESRASGDDGASEGRGRRKDDEDPDRVPSAFSDATTASEDVDLSAMTEEERAAYLAQSELRRKEREERRRAKYGDRYEEIMKKKQEKKEQERRALEEKRAEEKEREEEKERQAQENRDRIEQEKEDLKRRRQSINLKTTTSMLQKKEKPKSMVTYEKAPPRGLDKPIEKTDNRDIGPSHSDWLRSERRMSRDDSNLSSYRHGYGRMKTSDDLGKGHSKRRMPDRGELIDREKQRQLAAAESKKATIDRSSTFADDALLEIDESGKVRLKMGKKIDLSKISDDMLRKLGIDPSLSKKAKAKLLKKLLGDDVTILDHGQMLGFKSLSEYDLKEVTDDMLADDPDLDIDTLSGQRRVNVLMRRGGLALREHMMKVMEESRLMDDQAYRNDLDEKDGTVDFMTHYRLVNPTSLEGYAKAFVVEDQDLDTVITLSESKTALEGISTVNHLTPKQMDYVFKVLNITDATQVTFRMFAVVTALCERVSTMDPLSKHLLEMCNLADIERKLDLYQNMFYHNRRGDRDGNFIKAEALKIELIAGGLNWKQQKYIMEKMEMNDFREISFLDYMCYIPLFLSMHDNIVDNPLDMSDQKYSQPPRTRPASSQRDMNPLGFPLSKKSSLLQRKQAKDLMEGRLSITGLRPETRERLQRFARLPPIKRRKSSLTGSSFTSELSTERTKTEFFLHGHHHKY